MKKWLLALVILLGVAISCLYIFIPNKITINQTLSFPINTKAFVRNIQVIEEWKNWWPDKNSALTKPTQLTYNGRVYSLLEKRFSSALISVKEGNDSLLSEFIFIPSGQNEISLQWNGVAASPVNPLSRLQEFLWIQHVKNDLHDLLQQIQTFYSSEQNLYGGLTIQKASVTDSILISTFGITPAYTSTEAIYALIDRLQEYALKNGAKQVNPPMLNITSTDSDSFRAQVALPVNKRLKDSAQISYRWMLGGGNILVAEVKGGPKKISDAFTKMAAYIEDNGRTAPAIQFQSLITDRRAEPDTNKWITKLYWPVM